MGRSELREHIFKMIFGVEFSGETPAREQFELYLEQLEQVKEKDYAYMLQKAEAVLGHLEEIDSLINGHASGWKTSRMNKVDLTILRLAVYEMKWDGDIPEKVAVNEAVELAKRFSGEDGPAFVNGVLGKMMQS